MTYLPLEKSALLMALPIESQGLFEKERISIHYSGIGKINAAMKAVEIIFRHKPKVIINLGTAGSNKLPSHSLVHCQSFVQKDMDLTPLGFPRGETPMDPISGLITASVMELGLTRGVCGTGDAFEVGEPALACDLVDMEAYAIAKACLMHGVDFVSIKYITDGNDHRAHQDWRDNLKPAAHELLRVYKQLVGL